MDGGFFSFQFGAETAAAFKRSRVGSSAVGDRLFVFARDLVVITFIRDSLSACRSGRCRGEPVVQDFVFRARPFERVCNFLLFVR